MFSFVIEEVPDTHTNSDVHKYLRESNQLYHSKDYITALKLINSALDAAEKNDPSLGMQCLNRKCAILMKMNRFKEAVKCSEKMILQNPNYWKSYLRKGTALAELKEYHNSVTALEMAKNMLLKHSDEEYKTHIGIIDKCINTANINIDKDTKKYCHNCHRVVDTVHNKPPCCEVVNRSHLDPREGTGETSEGRFLVKNWTYVCCKRAGSSCTEVDNPSHVIDFFDPPGCTVKVKKHSAHVFV